MDARGALVRVHLRGAVDIPAGLAVSARITRESAELLGLRPGMPVQALCKATAVRVLGLPESGQGGNAWPGRATRVSRGGLGDEVAVRLDAGLQMVGFAAPGSALRARSRVVLVADESAIVLAVVGM